MNKRYSNALLHETSPYLLQHAHNPVNWYPWGDEALNLAKEKDLPILVSIGYSACHWCHVMERESFENEEVAAYMNENFVNIKIDREERPDLDHIYMDAVQAMSGSGGWPLNVFLTTSGSPFYGGTYFPPTQAFNRASWPEVLRSVSQLWQSQREEVESQAQVLVDHLQKSNSFATELNILPDINPQDFYNAPDCKKMAENILKNAEARHGGFGKAPKFLQTFSMQYLLSYSFYSGDSTARDHVIFTLQKMLDGGIYDQLAGGISRYSTDDRWLVPHFEKMLYDNALFTTVLCEAYQLTGIKAFENGIRRTLNFLFSEMKHAEGGFFTALDADSEGVEGKFYVWKKFEVEEVLGSDADLFCDYFNVTEEGNWEETNILHVSEAPAEIASRHGISVAQLEATIATCSKKLLRRRAARIRPGTDDKILLSSNALLITALCKAYAALGDDHLKAEAVELFEFVQHNMKDKVSGGLYLHTYKEGKAKVPAFLDDYSYLVQACIHLQEITSDQEYLKVAVTITKYLLNNYTDEQGVFFFYTHKDHKDPIIRKVEVYDGATPSANAVMASNLFYLGIVFDNQQWHIRAQSMLQSLSNVFVKHPSSFGVWANAFQAQAAGINEIAIAGSRIESTLKQLLKVFIPNKIVQSATAEQPFPLLLEKDFSENVTIYLCRNYECKQPVAEIKEVLTALSKPVFGGIQSQ